MQERRAHNRHRTFIKGRIYFNNRLASHDCIIRDVSDGGSRLEFTESVTLPERFELHIPSKDEYYLAQVRWRKGTNLGVSLHAEAAPETDDGRGDLSVAERIARLEHEVAALHQRLDALQRG